MVVSQLSTLFASRVSLVIRRTVFSLSERAVPVQHNHNVETAMKRYFCVHSSVLAACKTTGETAKAPKKMGVTPAGKLDERLPDDEYVHPDGEKEPLKAWPGGINSSTGERGGPKGPEPTRYGDWERKGRVSDF